MEEGGLVDVTPQPYTVTCSPGTDAEKPGRENTLILSLGKHSAPSPPPRLLSQAGQRTEGKR